MRASPRPVSLHRGARIAGFGLRALLPASPLACTPFPADGPVAANDASPGADTAQEALPRASSPADAATSQIPSSCDPQAPFGPPTLVAGLASLMATWAGGLRLAPDYRVSYFNTNLGPAGSPSNPNDSNLYTAARADTASPFAGTAPLAGAGINSADNEVSPTVRGDGLFLIFARYAPGQAPGLHYATRSSLTDSFTYAGPVFASGWDPFLRQDGEVLYLADHTDGGADWDIYRSTRSDPIFGSPTPVAELNSSFDDAAPVVTPDDLTIYFASRRPVGASPQSSDPASLPYGIWTATRASPSASFSAPSQVQELDLAGDDVPSFVTADGCTLYFTVAPPFNAADLLYVAQKPSP